MGWEFVPFIGTFKASKNTLEGKSGRTCKGLELQIELLKEFKPLQYWNLSDVEKFSDLLVISDHELKLVTIVDKLGTRSLYLKLQRKLR